MSELSSLPRARKATTAEIPAGPAAFGSCVSVGVHHLKDALHLHLVLESEECSKTGLLVFINLTWGLYYIYIVTKQKQHCVQLSWAKHVSRIIFH